ncbi:MAG: deoxynucleoside kinase [Bacteroidales bacterium]|jgi:deoxyadenosine/deoxycytidine kinase|nr:deoxynucleoside kinase [Bacteroidales bacterium]
MAVTRYNYIVIEGNIGAGKTTLASMIAKEHNAKLILERFADNPFLPKFYSDPARFSFPLELSFLADRYRQLKEELVEQDLFRSFTVADYYFMKSLVFASSTLEKDEFTLYRQIFYIIYSSLPKPDLYVYLHVPPERLLLNIALRGREYEKSITAEYLTGIQESYFTFFRQNPENRYLILEINDLDFVMHPEDYRKVTDVIFNEVIEPGMNLRIF